MKLALLGADDDALVIARSVAESSEHELAWACELGAAAATVRSFAPSVQLAPHWETLVGGTVADAVIVARGANDDDRAEQLRKLVQAAVPLLIVHPVHDSMLIYYELDMIRRETGGVMLPCVPYRWHDGLARLDAIVRAGAASDVGATGQIVLDRAMATRTRALVEAQFARDAALLRALAGDLTSVSALAPAGDETAAYANLGVQLTGASGILVRWSVGPVEHVPGARLMLVGGSGKASLYLPAAGEPSRLEIVRGGETRNESIPAWSPPAAAIAQLQAAMAGRQAAPTWPDACRDVELAESIARSLAKGRTIELHNEEHSEHGTFKGTMTSLGCGLLWAVLVVFLVAAVLAKITGNALFAYAPHFILGVLVLFLAIQSLKLAFPSED
ncbi:MAG: hypothetical protein HYX69_16000 [Planctomycetia bacterium]|nr:hypothetical protein [Planctomycetia bacterium]